MKKQLNFLLLSILFSSTVLISCKKDDDPDEKTNTELITAGTWRFGAAFIGTADVSSGLQTCQKDNTMVFAAAGTGTLDEGPTKCNSADPQTVPFTWSFSSNETILNVSATLFTGGSNTFNVVTINESQLVLSQTVTISGTPQNVTVTFLH